jgi:hypothetical protein
MPIATKGGMDDVPVTEEWIKVDKQQLIDVRSWLFQSLQKVDALLNGKQSPNVDSEK